MVQDTSDSPSDREENQVDQDVLELVSLFLQSVKGFELANECPEDFDGVAGRDHLVGRQRQLDVGLYEREDWI